MSRSTRTMLAIVAAAIAVGAVLAAGNAAEAAGPPRSGSAAATLKSISLCPDSVPGCKQLKGVVHDVTGAVTHPVTSAVNAAVDSGAKNLAEVFIGAWDSVMKSFLTSWLKVGIGVDLNGSAMHWLTSSLSELAAALAVLGVMIAGIWTMIDQRGTHAKRAAGAVFRVLLVSGAGTALMTVLIPTTDSFSSWILDQAGVTVSSWQGGAYEAVVATNPGLAIIAGIFGVMATIFQWAIMLVRAAFLPLLIGVWPTSAAAAVIRGAEGSFSKITAWIFAFLLYKPAAAIVYAFAWKLKSSDAVGEVIDGLILLCVACLAMPAILRVLAPATSAMGSAFGGGMGLAATGAMVTAGVAAGAAVFSGGGSLAMGGSTGPSTASGSSPAPAPGPSPDASSPPAPSPSGNDGQNGSQGPGGATGGPGSTGAPPPSGSGTEGLQPGVQSLAGSFADGAGDGGSSIDETIGG